MGFADCCCSLLKNFCYKVLRWVACSIVNYKYLKFAYINFWVRAEGLQLRACCVDVHLRYFTFWLLNLIYLLAYSLFILIIEIFVILFSQWLFSVVVFKGRKLSWTFIIIPEYRLHHSFRKLNILLSLVHNPWTELVCTLVYTSCTPRD
jgi:hypothetical protein